jgi:hypothetical protein
VSAVDPPPKSGVRPLRLRRASDRGLYFVAKVKEGFRPIPPDLRALLWQDRKLAILLFRSSENGGGSRQGDYHYDVRYQSPNNLQSTMYNQVSDPLPTFQSVISDQTRTRSNRCCLCFVFAVGANPHSRAICISHNLIVVRNSQACHTALSRCIQYVSQWENSSVGPPVTQTQGRHTTVREVRNRSLIMFCMCAWAH